jgi:hypothetical protein
MNDSNDTFLLKVLVLAIAGYAAVQALTALIAAFTALLNLLVIITAVAVAIVAFCYVYRRHIAPALANRDYKTHQVTEIDAERERTIQVLPSHIRDHADTYYKEKQREVYNPNPPSAFDKTVDAAKQVVSIYRPKK